MTSNKFATYLLEINKFRDNLEYGYSILPLNIKTGHALLINKYRNNITNNDNLVFSFLFKEPVSEPKYLRIDMNPIKNENNLDDDALFKLISFFVSDCIINSRVSHIGNKPVFSIIHDLTKNNLKTIKFWSKAIANKEPIIKNIQYSKDIFQITDESILDTLLNNFIVKIFKNNSYTPREITVNKKAIQKEISLFSRELKRFGFNDKIKNIDISIAYNSLFAVDFSIADFSRKYLVPLKYSDMISDNLTNLLDQKLDYSFAKLNKIILFDLNNNYLFLKNAIKRHKNTRFISNIDYIEDRSNISSALHSFIEENINF